MPRILISYRRVDTAAVVGRIGDHLIAAYGADAVFMDVDTIPFGTDFRTAAQEFLKEADAVVAIIGPSWLGVRDDGTARIADAADPVRTEIETALTFGLPLIPVLVLGGTMPDQARLPNSIRSMTYLNAAPIDVGRDFGVHMGRLIATLDEILIKKGMPSSSGPRLAGFSPPPAMIIGITMTVCAGLILPFAAAWANYAPPAPRGSATIAALVEAAMIVFAFLMLRASGTANIRRIRVLACVALAFVATGYLFLVQSYTYETPTTRQLFAMGYQCTPEAELLYKYKCLAANIGNDELMGAEYEAERLWTRRSIDIIKIALFVSWIVGFIVLGLLIGLVQTPLVCLPDTKRREQ